MSLSLGVWASAVGDGLDDVREAERLGVRMVKRGERVGPMGETLDEQITGLGQLVDLVAEVDRDDPAAAAGGAATR